MELDVGGALTGSSPPLRRNRDFATLWSGQAVSELGSSMSVLVFPLIGYAITGSAALAGLATAAALLGGVVAGLPAGTLVDRWPRRRVLLVGNLAGVAVFGGLAGATFAHHLTLPHLIMGGFASGVVGSFLDPAASAAVRAVVPRSNCRSPTRGCKLGGTPSISAGHRWEGRCTRSRAVCLFSWMPSPIP